MNKVAIRVRQVSTEPLKDDDAFPDNVTYEVHGKQEA
jgi:hypothetical protein